MFCIVRETTNVYNTLLLFNIWLRFVWSISNGVTGGCISFVSKGFHFRQDDNDHKDDCHCLTNKEIETATMIIIAKSIRLRFILSDSSVPCMYK